MAVSDLLLDRTSVFTGMRKVINRAFSFTGHLPAHLLARDMAKRGFFFNEQEQSICCFACSRSVDVDKPNMTAKSLRENHDTAHSCFYSKIMPQYLQDDTEDQEFLSKHPAVKSGCCTIEQARHCLNEGIPIRGSKFVRDETASNETEYNWNTCHVCKQWLSTLLHLQCQCRTCAECCLYTSSCSSCNQTIHGIIPCLPVLDCY